MKILKTRSLTILGHIIEPAAQLQYGLLDSSWCYSLKFACSRISVQENKYIKHFAPANYFCNQHLMYNYLIARQILICIFVIIVRHFKLRFRGCLKNTHYHSFV